ncbi:hypothetical protein FB451DRAFT_1337421 [Mycena latifolia]|nr:hypothetical protein FB451DRAFT_1337421 [Mycena latifolia]
MRWQYNRPGQAQVALAAGLGDREYERSVGFGWSARVAHVSGYPQQQQGFDLPYPAPGASYDELIAQFDPQHHQQIQQAQQVQQQIQQYAAYTPPSTSASHSTLANGNTNANATSPNTSNATGSAPKRKRAVEKAAQPSTQSQAYSDSDSDDGDGFSGDISVGMGGLGVRSKSARSPGACTHCKKLKMKCELGPAPAGSTLDSTCRRCRAGGHVCIRPGRKPRSPPNKGEYLLAQIRQKDAIIESLLKQLHNPYIATPLSIASYRMATSPSDTTNHNILAWLDQLRASVRAGSAPTAGAGPSSDARAFSAASFKSTNPNFASNPAFEDSPDEDAGEDGGDDGEEGESSSALPDARVPLGLIANLSLSNRRSRERRTGEGGREEELEELDDDNVGVANAAYFMPGPATDLGMRAHLIEQHGPPEILMHGLVVPEDVDKLFEIFYERINPFVALLDPVLHTPASTFARCPFLFTVVCAISSRYYPEKSEIYPIAMHFAKHAAANALIDGWKSVELCQAYILMSTFAVPARKWEEDRSWLYTGLAIRLATDLNLHQVASGARKNRGDERAERELLNRTRVWISCFNLDRSTATQFGKPSMIKEDYILRHRSDDWYKKSPYNTPYDIHMCGYTALLLLVARFYDDIFSDPTSPSGLNKHVDFRTVTITHDANLSRFSEEWTARFALDSDANGGPFLETSMGDADYSGQDRTCALWCKLLPFLVAYSRLVMFSFGFQQPYQRGLQPPDHIFFSKCLESAKAVLRNMVEGLAPTGFMRYAPDGRIRLLLRPEFSHLMAKEQENEVFDLIGRLIQTLSSPEIAIDDRHTPKLYARFLAGLLSRHRRDGATVGRLHPQPPAQQSMGSSSPMPGAGAVLGPEHGAQGYGNVFGQADKLSTPIYRPETTYSGPIQHGVEMDLGTGLPDEEQMPAAMQALKNPAWWDNQILY